jgi:hypothetical protein
MGCGEEAVLTLLFNDLIGREADRVPFVTKIPNVSLSCCEQINSEN